MTATISNADILRSGYDAFARGDIPAVLALFDPAIEWYSPEELPGGGTYRGPDGVARFFTGLPEHYQELLVRPQRFLADGDCVIAEGILSGRIGGVAFEAGFAHVWTMRAGKATRFREYTDTGKLLPLVTAAAPSVAGAG
jgi:hypothetical protein